MKDHVIPPPPPRTKIRPEDVLKALTRKLDLSRELTVINRLLKENPEEKVALVIGYIDGIVGGALPTKQGHDTELDPTGLPATDCWQKASRCWTDVLNRFRHEALPTDGSKSRVPRVFLESGSTLLLFSYYLSQRLPQGPLQFSLRTNNDLAAWFFLDRQCPGASHGFAPFLLTGNLEEKYHGLFPFYSKHLSPEHGPRALASEMLAEEKAAYSHCRIELARNDLLLLAASRLSLCFGPFVGSRENAIFKNACYNACVPSLGKTVDREIHLFITIQKLVAHHPENARAARAAARPTQPDVVEAHQADSTSPFDGFHTIEEELKKLRSRDCFSVFDILPPVPQQGQEEWQPDEAILSPFWDSLCSADIQHPLRDGSVAVTMGEGRFRVCRTWGDLFAKGHLKVKVFLSYRASGGSKAEGVDIASSRPSGEDDEGWIRREIQVARKYFAGRVRIDFEGAPRQPADGFAIGCITLSPGNSADSQAR